MAETVNACFVREVLPHEAVLMRYLARICPNRDDIADLRQEVYVRIYDAAKHGFPVPVRPLLINIARNLVIDRARHHRIVSIHSAGSSDISNVLVDDLSPERRVGAGQELKALARAFALLPPKCREVVWHTKVHGLPYVEVARRLGISLRTVQFHTQKGMRILAETVFVDDATTVLPAGADSNEHEGGTLPLKPPNELEHGK